LIEKTQDITTKDGEMETFICHPERNGPSPAVFLLMDAYGVREELKDMAAPARHRRLLRAAAQTSITARAAIRSMDPMCRRRGAPSTVARGPSAPR
jgi:hypothetical protein